LHGLSVHEKIRYDIENSLRFAGTRRPLNNADLIIKRVSHGLELAGISAERKDEAVSVECLDFVLFGVEIDRHGGIITDKFQLFILLLQEYLAIIILQFVDRRNLAQIAHAVLRLALGEARIGDFERLPGIGA